MAGARNLVRSIESSPLRIPALIFATAVSGCASAGLHPGADTVARIETGLALIQDVQEVGVSESSGMTSMARTSVRNLQCTAREPAMADCTYDVRRTASPSPWEARRRTFVRSDGPASGAAQADGWVSASENDSLGRGPASIDLGLWDPPDGPQIQVADIPPPMEEPGAETLIAQMAPSEWAKALSSSSGRVVPAEAIRRVECVGLETSYMLCGWEQQFGNAWRQRSQYADISQKDGTAIRLIGEPEPER